MNVTNSKNTMNFALDAQIIPAKKLADIISNLTILSLIGSSWIVVFWIYSFKGAQYAHLFLCIQFENRLR